MLLLDFISIIDCKPKTTIQKQSKDDELSYLTFPAVSLLTLSWEAKICLIHHILSTLIFSTQPLSSVSEALSLITDLHRTVPFCGPKSVFQKSIKEGELLHFCLYIQVVFEHIFGFGRGLYIDYLFITPKFLIANYYYHLRGIYWWKP